MPLNIVLFEPEIPNNTGNIGRLSLATNARLHLVKPLGFKLDEKRVRRAGLDYWKHVDLTLYESKEEFFLKNVGAEMIFLSTHGEKSIWDAQFNNDTFLIFGKESVGLSKEIHKNHEAALYHIPIDTQIVRSLNLANAVSIVIYEGLRQLKMRLN